MYSYRRCIPAEPTAAFGEYWDYIRGTNEDADSPTCVSPHRRSLRSSGLRHLSRQENIRAITPRAAAWVGRAQVRQSPFHTKPAGRKKVDAHAAPYPSKCAPPGPEGRGLGPAGEIGVWARVGRAQPRDEQSTPPTAPARLERSSRVAESDREDLYSDAVDRTWRRC